MICVLQQKILEGKKVTDGIRVIVIPATQKDLSSGYGRGAS